MINIGRHYSAYKGEITKLFGLKPGLTFLDLTLGDGGHTEEALMAGCRVVSFDIDENAIKRATGFVSEFTPIIINPEEFHDQIPSKFKWIIIKSNFIKVADICQQLSLPKFDGIMVDLGPSQFQVLSDGRGFSFSSDEPLDMRLDQSSGVTAADLLSALNEGELAELFSLSDEEFAKPLARVIASRRQVEPIKTTKQLADLVVRVKRGRAFGKIHPATKVFMALRMAVNLERENIRLLLPQLPGLLNPNGIVGIISFHSGEDKLVKDYFRLAEEQEVLRAINQKPIEVTTQELTISPRTRSAKLRLATKI